MIAIFCLAKGGLRQHQNYCSEQAMVAVDMGGMAEVLLCLKIKSKSTVFA